MSEANLQKLKVTELKELLSKHDLPQTGKKDDLVKRLVENNISPDGEGQGAEDELVAPEEENTAPAASAPTTTEEAPKTDPTTAPAPATEAALTPEQQAMKSRAERFGIAFNPNPTSTTKSKPSTSSTTAPASSTAATPAPVAAQKEKAGAIDKAPLGISEEVLAKRAAKFGLPDKKEEKAAPETKAKEAESAKPKSEAELTPEMKEKLAVEEEKKRKRAEKFGTAKPAKGTEESDAKKLKV